MSKVSADAELAALTEMLRLAGSSMCECGHFATCYWRLDEESEAKLGSPLFFATSRTCDACTKRERVMRDLKALEQSGRNNTKFDVRVAEGVVVFAGGEKFSPGYEVRELETAKLVRRQRELLTGERPGPASPFDLRINLDLPK